MIPSILLRHGDDLHVMERYDASVPCVGMACGASLPAADVFILGVGEDAGPLAFCPGCGEASRHAVPAAEEGRL